MQPPQEQPEKHEVKSLDELYHLQPEQLARVTSIKLARFSVNGKNVKAICERY